MSSTVPKVDVLRHKVHLTQRLLEDKHEQSQSTNGDLISKREKLNKAENEYYDLKQKISQIQTGRTHASIDIDYSSKKLNNFNKKLQRENDKIKLNEDNLDLLKKEHANLKNINESLQVEYKIANSENMRRKTFDDMLATTKLELMKKNIENTVTPVLI